MVQIFDEDWRSLMSLMLPNPHKHGYLLCNYAPLIPIENRILFYFRAYEHLRFVLYYTNNIAYRAILEKLPYTNRWFQITEGNYLLEASLKHKKYGFDDNMEKARHPETFLRLDRCFMIEEVGEELHKHDQLRCLKPHTLFFYEKMEYSEESCAMIYHDQLDNPQATVGKLLCTLEELY
uniref:Uncharacterized protein n=1 Tax=Oryza punctata TaxID=4537 RepID=A0A0E0LL79_ORYPU